MSTPAGWYPQPDGTQRYWDGEQWTEHIHTPDPVPPTYAVPPPAAGGGGGMGKGCLIAGIIALIVVVLIAVAGVFAARRFVEKVDEVMTFPTALPVPSDALPEPAPPGEEAPQGEEDLGDHIPEGEAFTIGEYSVKAGWSIESGSFLGSIDNLEFETPARVAVLLDVTLFAGDQRVDTTICTVPEGETAASCLPLTEDVAAADSAAFSSLF